jgi:general secretion pathway protein I
MCAERSRTAGFTLLEAMVALVIVALGMMAVATQINRYVVAAHDVEEKTLASWIATNKITELSVGKTWPGVDEYDEELDYANRHWKLHVEVSETDVKNLHRVDVSVALGDRPNRMVWTVSGLIEPPAPPGFPPVLWPVPAGGTAGEHGGGERG